MTGTPKPIPNHRLRNERERRCWSQQELADRVGTTPLNVSRWERGITLPSPYFRQKLCEVFEKSVQELGLVPGSVQESKQVEPSQPVTTAIATATQEIPKTFWNVPYNRNLLFTGREDILAQLRAALTSEEQPIALAQPQAISGLGGIGKTQTAVEYAYRYRDNYTAVLWARADSHDLLVSDFLLIASFLNLPERNEQDQSKVVNAVKRWFDTHEQWLLILDNADNLEVVNEFIPSSGKGHVLLTTRAHSTGTVAQRIELEKMGVGEGTLFLLRRAKLLKGNASLNTLPEAVRKQAQTIVEVVDGLPLALDQAGAYIEETGCSLSDYLRFYKTRRNRLLRTRGRDATGHPEPVATTWSLSFEKVEQANPAAAELLRLCAFLHPDEIPEAMIREGASELGPILQPVAEDEMELNEAIGELHKYSLVKRDPELKVLNIHRLVQAVLKDTLDKEIQREWAERNVRLVNQAFPNPEEFALWSTCQQYLSHVQICAELIEQWRIATPKAAELLNNAGKYLYKHGQYEEAEQFLIRALTIREQILGSNDPCVAESLNILAELYDDQSKYTQAESLYKRALTIREQALGLEHPDVAETLNDLALLYHTQGKYALAEQLYQRAILIREYALGPEHYYVAQSLENLALIYIERGKYVEAEPLCQRALNIRKKVRGPNHPDVAYSLSNLGHLYLKQSKYAQAESLFLQSLNIDEQALGPNHPEVAHDLNNLAILYSDQGMYEQAQPLFQRALAMREQVLGPNHPKVGHSMNGLARLYCDQGMYEQAELLFRRALSIREQSLGADHRDVAVTLESYAILLHKTNREADAIALEERAKTIRAKQE